MMAIEYTKRFLGNGFEFESSVPKWLPKFIMDPDDPRFLPSAMVHDYMLRRGFGAISSGAE